MPRFNPFTGEVLAGVAGMRPSVDGVSYGPSVGSTSPTVWFDTDNILHQVSGAVAKTNIRTSTTVILGGAANELEAGCKSKYLAWNGSTGLFGDIVLPLGGLNRVITDSRGAASVDGCLAYIPVRAVGGGPTIIRNAQGQEVQLPDMYGLHILKWGQAVWNSPTTVGVLDFWGTTCAYIPGGQYAKLAKLGNALWIVYELGGQIIAHPAINPTVYYTVVASGFAYHIDAIALAGKLCVTWSLTTGEGPADIQKNMDVVGTSPTTAMPSNTVAGGDTAGPTVPPEDQPTTSVEIKLPEFADLKTILAQTKDVQNPLYQTVQKIIERLDSFKVKTVDQLQQVSNNSGASNGNLIRRLEAGTYLTKNDDSLILPNSTQVLAGSGIVFDDSTKGKRYIKLGYYEAPLTDGNVDETDLIFANGECVIVQVPNVP